MEGQKDARTWWIDGSQFSVRDNERGGINLLVRSSRFDPDTDEPPYGVVLSPPEAKLLIIELTKKLRVLGE